MTHQGPKAALGEGGSAHGCGSRRCCRGQHSKRCFLVPLSPGQLLPCQEGFALHLPECLPAERPEGELKWLRMGTGAWPGGRTEQGDYTRTQPVPAQSTPRRHHPIALSEHSTIALLHKVCSEGDHRSAFTGNAAMLSSSSWGASLGTVGCSGPHCTPWPSCSSLSIELQHLLALRLLHLPGSEVTRHHIQQRDW